MGIVRFAKGDCMSNLARKERVKKLREAGAKAHAEGKSIQTCPEKFMDEFQWKQGWIDAKEENARRLCKHQTQFCKCNVSQETLSFCFGCGFGHTEKYDECVWDKDP
jgi:ribosome modulation factor